MNNSEMLTRVVSGLAELFEITPLEVTALIQSGDVLVSPTQIPVPAGFSAAYLFKPAGFACVSIAASRAFSGRMRSALLAELQQGNQASAQRIFRKLNPASVVKSQLTLAQITTLDSTASHVEVVHAPSHVRIPATSQFSVAHEYTTERAVFATVPNASYVSGWDYMLRDGAVISDSGYQDINAPSALWPHQVFPQSSLVAHLDGAHAEINEEAIFLSAPVVAHVGHWIIDFLPRLLAREFKKLRFVVPDTLSAKHYEMLAAFGLTQRDIICVPVGQHVKFKALHFYRPGQSMPPNPRHVEFVRRGLFKGTAPRAGKRLFLTRNDVNTRLAVNHAELTEWLNSKGFAFVEMAELSLAQQQEVLGDAEIVMGAFGSNMLALYHAPAGARIVVLQTPEMGDPTLPHTAFMLGMEHRRLMVASVERSGAPVSLKKDVNFLVNIEDLSRVTFSQS